ncbi:hypothetical protein ACFV2U_28675 [Streptomyces sp. NPDC059697]
MSVTKPILLGLTLQQARGTGVDELVGKQVYAPMDRWQDAGRS